MVIHKQTQIMGDYPRQLSCFWKSMWITSPERLGNLLFPGVIHISALRQNVQSLFQTRLQAAPFFFIIRETQKRRHGCCGRPYREIDRAHAKDD